jgi:hypothetical protein
VRHGQGSVDTDSIQQQLLEAQRLMQQQVALPPLLLLRHAEPRHHGTLISTSAAPHAV